MISYCWAQKKIVKWIYSELKRLKFKVWFDEDKMTGSTIKAMAHAVENSEIFLMCCSRRYKNSANCQSGKYLENCKYKSNNIK